MKPFHLIATGLVTAACLTAGGCARTQAKAALEPPRLDVPLPPPRVIETVEVELTPPVLPPSEPALSTEPLKSTNPTPPPRRLETATGVEPAKPDAAAIEPRPDEPRSTGSPLQIVPAQQEARVEGEVRTLLRTANNTLGRVDYGKLGKDARIQYDQAKTYMQQAEEALKSKNSLYARTLAGKASDIAAQLSGR